MDYITINGKRYPISDFRFPSKPKTNADRIRGMTDEEMAEWLAKHNERSAVCPNFGAHDCQASCRKCWLDWLKQEAKE